MNDYGLDLTGNNPSNLIIERQTISQLNNSYQVIIPKASPFFLDGLIVTSLGTVNKILTKGVHYDVALEFMAGTRFIAKPLYACIVIIDPMITGSLELHYQTLGGVYTTDYQSLLNTIVERNINPRVAYYDQLINMPAYFPPLSHVETAANFTYQTLIEKINALTTIVANKELTQRAYILYRPANSDEVLSVEDNDTVLTPTNTAPILNDLLRRIAALEQQIT